MLRWFDRVMRKDKAEKVFVKTNVEGNKRREKPEKTWMNEMKSDTRIAD